MYLKLPKMTTVLPLVRHCKGHTVRVLTKAQLAILNRHATRGLNYPYQKLDWR